MKKTASGFTLMEMITVMAIATLITIASAPAFMNFARTRRIRGAASNISSALNSARRYAITRNTEYAVHIYADNYDGDSNLKNSFLFWETETNTERRLIHRTVEIIDVDGGGKLTGADGDGEYEFVFTSRGAARQGGTITLRDTGPAGRELEIDITIFNTTGRVKIGDLQEP